VSQLRLVWWHRRACLERYVLLGELVKRDIALVFAEVQVAAN